MTDSRVLVLHPSGAAKIRSGLKHFPLRAVAFESVSEAVSRAPWPQLGAVIADVKTLTAPGSGRARRLETRLRDAIATLRRASEQTELRLQFPRRLVVIVTSEKAQVAEHAAAIKAGADLYLTEQAAAHEAILPAYLDRMLRTRTTDSVPAAPAPAVAPEPPSATELFGLPTERLRSESGRLDAARIARALGVPLKTLAPALQTGYTTVHKTPDSAAVQAALTPFADVLAMLDEVFGGDSQRVLKWLQSPQEGLGNLTPQAAMLTPGGAAGVQQLVSGAWLGEPE